MSGQTEQFIDDLPGTLFWIGQKGRCYAFVFKGDGNVSFKSVQDLTCEDCLHNEPSFNGWCDLHHKNTFKLGVSTCSQCSNKEKLEFKDACADYQTKTAGTGL